MVITRSVHMKKISDEKLKEPQSELFDEPQERDDTAKPLTFWSSGR